MSVAEPNILVQMDMGKLCCILLRSYILNVNINPDIVVL